MTLWNPVYRVQINGDVRTSATLSGLTITSGRTDIYSQALAGYCNLTLIETNESAVSYEINTPVTIEVQDSSGNYIPIFGGYITDIAINVQTSGSTALSQQINIIAVGALARLNRAIYVGNFAHQFDGDRIYELLQGLLLNSWDEVPAATSWNNYNSTTTWANAENNGLGDIDTPGDYELHSENNVNETYYNLAARFATSALGYLYEDAQGRISYADSSHRAEYLASNGYIDLDANHAIGPGLNIVKKAGDVKNNITIGYGTSSASVSAEDLNSMGLYGNLASTIQTTLRNQADAQSQADFYLLIRAYPQYAFRNITFTLANPELDDFDRDALINVFMGLPINLTNLPNNMVNGNFQGFVEGWTWTASLNRLDLTLTLSPLAFSLQSMKWSDVSGSETWTTIDSSLEWIDATIVA